MAVFPPEWCFVDRLPVNQGNVNVWVGCKETEMNLKGRRAVHTVKREMEAQKKREYSR